MKKFLIAGLGNPGTRYANTRHNAGTDLINLFLEKNSLELKENKSIKGEISSLKILDVEVFFLIPNIFMNHSGKSLKPTIKKLNLPLNKVLIIHDDLDLPSGTCKLKDGGGDGGHNGIKSINYIINATDYFRLRIGVGRPPSGIDPAEYVLSRFLSDEIEEIKFLVEDAIDIVKVFPKDKEMAIKQASERRIIDVV